MGLVGYGCIQYDGELHRHPAPAAAPSPGVTHVVNRTIVQHIAPALSGTDLVIILVVVVIGIVGGLAVYMNGSRWRHQSR
jgi:hypothetical protein